MEDIRLTSRSSGLWRRVVLRQDANVSEDLAASIFEVWNVGNLLQHCMESQSRRPRLFISMKITNMASVYATTLLQFYLKEGPHIEKSHLL
jgi:hypothetical protein